MIYKSLLVKRMRGEIDGGKKEFLREPQQGVSLFGSGWAQVTVALRWDARGGEEAREWGRWMLWTN